MSTDEEYMQCEAEAAQYATTQCDWKAQLRVLIPQLREEIAKLPPQGRAEYQKTLEIIAETELELDMEDMTV